MADVDELISEFESLSNDYNKWMWLRNHQDVGIRLWVELDNDCTVLVFGDVDEAPISHFDDYIGWSDGVQSLLQAVGIDAEPC